MPSADVYNRAEFNGKIIFHPETGITTEEQLLCTAAAIAFVIYFLFIFNIILCLFNFPESYNEASD